MNLTLDQSKAFEKIKDFLVREEEGIFLLKGYAGTGKTFLINSIAEYLGKNKVEFNLMAPTGRAARVLSKSTGRPAHTIHKSIYNLNDIREVHDKETNESNVFYFFNLRVNIEEAVKVIIVDEASMIGDNYSFQEVLRYGSGRLLKDLIDFTRINGNENVKLIFVGDNAQLPPVKESFSPALAENYLQENYCRNVEEYTLEEVLRHSEGSILDAATSIRKSLSKKIFNKLEFDYSKDDINKAEIDDIKKVYKNTNPANLDYNSVILAYTNKQVSDYNEIIRTELGFDVKGLNINERLIVVKNSYFSDINLYNGDFVILNSFSEANEKVKVPIKMKGENDRHIELVFRDVELNVKNNKGNYRKLKCKIFENLLFSANRDLTIDEHKALYIYFCIRNPELKKSSKEFKEKLAKDPYFNSVRVKFGYAVTVHKSQGGEWNNVYTDMFYTNGRSSADYFRWVYTAITRAKKNLYIYNDPVLNQFSKMKISNSNEESGILMAEDLKAVEFQNDEIISNIPDEPWFLKSLYTTINNKLNSEFNIVSIRHLSWCERYLLRRDNNEFIVDLYYNKKGRISNIKALTKDEKPESKSQKEKLLKIFENLLGKRLEKSINGISSNSVSFDNDALKEIYNGIKKKIDSFAQITDVKHLNYCERYTFESGNKKAVIDLIYNGKMMITNIRPLKKECSSDDFTNELLRNIR